ncbi:MAG: hypothetical protein L6420_06195 [Elusimicrobia bacterium]|nr:hypothetical protein [Elusimicrobiota bacterium]
MNFKPDDEKTYAMAKDKELIESLIHAMERQKPAILGELILRLKTSINDLETSNHKQALIMIILTGALVALTLMLIALPFYLEYTSNPNVSPEEIKIVENFIN